MSEARKLPPKVDPVADQHAASPEQLEVLQELYALMLQHNPEPTPEELAEIDRQWSKG